MELSFVLPLEGVLLFSEYLSKRMISDRCGMEGQTF